MANTIFSFSIVSLYFPVYLANEFGLPDAVFAIGNSASVALMVLISPALGALSDRARRRMPFLIGSTVACVVATAPLGVVGWQAAIVLFGVANVAFMAGLVVYDALLPVVSTPVNRGRVAAIGVGVGYLGSLLGLALGEALLRDAPRAVLFPAVAATFLLLALPCFLWVREPRRDPPYAMTGVMAGSRAAFAGLWGIIRGREHPRMGRLLLARIFYSDAANTMIIFMGIYVTRELGMSEGEAGLALLAGIVAAAVAAPLWGIAVDRVGPLRVLRVVLLSWMLALAMTAAVPWLGVPSATFYGVAAFLGVCLAGTWSSDRPLVVVLSPPAEVGKMFGYYGMVGRFSAIAGPLLWALVVDGLGWGRSAAVLTLMVSVVVGYFVLRGLQLDAPGAQGTGPALTHERP